jgi:hypothetical protein
MHVLDLLMTGDIMNLDLRATAIHASHASHNFWMISIYVSRVTTVDVEVMVVNVSHDGQPFCGTCRTKINRLPALLKRGGQSLPKMLNHRYTCPPHKKTTPCQSRGLSVTRYNGMT